MPSSSHIRNLVSVFTVLCAAALAMVLLDEFTGWRWVASVVNIGQELGRLFFTATAITFIIVEGGIMLAALYKRAARAEGREEANEAWRAWRTKWQEWSRNRDAAIQRGENFTEPEPDPPA